MTTLVLALMAVVAGLAALHWYMLSMPGRSHTGALPPVTDAQRQLARVLRQHVVAVASVPHNTGHPRALEASAVAIEERLRAWDYKPTAHRFTAHGIPVRNIEVVIEPTAGNGVAAGVVETLVVGAHYDSAFDAPGANDNGSGVAALLVVAERLRSHRPARTRLRLVFFVNEEPPHFQYETMGSLVYARALAATGEKVRAMLALETLGSYSDAPGSQRYPFPLGIALPSRADFVAVVGTFGNRPLAAEVTRRLRETTAFPSIGGVAPAIIPGIDWSDHWSFGQVGIPAVMITDTALFRYPYYHTPEDTPDKLDYERLARVTEGIVEVVRGMAP